MENIEIRIESDSPDEVFSDPESERVPSETEDDNGLENFKKAIKFAASGTLI
jgi:hypothetical protein